jgi:acyl carrier protein
MSIEDAFGIKVEEKDTVNIKTVGDIVNYIDK